MSLLNDNITEEIQKQIYVITAKLGSVPCSVRDCGGGVQVNWVVNGISYVWRSEDFGHDTSSWVEAYEGGDNAHPYNILISDLEMNKGIFDLL